MFEVVVFKTAPRMEDWEEQYIDYAFTIEDAQRLCHRLRDKNGAHCICVFDEHGVDVTLEVSHHDPVHLEIREQAL